MNNIELKAIRLRMGMTQAAMAERLGIGPRMYAYLEAGKRTMSKASAILAGQLLADHRHQK